MNSAAIGRFPAGRLCLSDRDLSSQLRNNYLMKKKTRKMSQLIEVSINCGIGGQD